MRFQSEIERQGVVGKPRMWIFGSAILLAGRGPSPGFSHLASVRELPGKEAAGAWEYGREPRAGGQESTAGPQRYVTSQLFGLCLEFLGHDSATI